MALREEQLELPVPLGDVELRLLREIRDVGFAVSSEGSDRWDALALIQRLGLAYAMFCPGACGVWQFQLTADGIAAAEGR